MFLGQYEHTIDDKNRLTLPARYRQSFEDGVVVSQGIDPCLNVYTREGWEQAIAPQLAALDPFSREGREMRRFLLAGGNEAEVDKQGRVTLPSPLVRKTGLGREVVVAGVGELLEVWDRETWHRKSAEFEERRDVVAERLAARES